MDLDGTSVRSEEFWIWIIQLTTASLLGNPRFELEEADLPLRLRPQRLRTSAVLHRKYCPDKTVEEARALYFEHTHREMRAIMEGRGRADAFMPAPGLKEFLLALKARGIKIGLVTSGLYEKAWPEILSAFRALGMGDPKDFYDAIITAGFPLRQGEAGTLGELSPKPHPWLYAEACRVGLGHPVRGRATRWSASRTAARASARSAWPASRPSAWPAATSSRAARAPVRLLLRDVGRRAEGNRVNQRSDNACRNTSSNVGWPITCSS